MNKIFVTGIFSLFFGISAYAQTPNCFTIGGLDLDGNELYREICNGQVACTVTVLAPPNDYGDVPCIGSCEGPGCSNPATRPQDEIEDLEGCTPSMGCDW